MGETFKAEAGLDIVHVPYRGTGEALPDLLAGVFHVYSDPVTLPHISAGRAKLLAVLDRERRPDFPNVPVLKEIYPALDFLLWFGIFAPPGDTSIDRPEHEPGDEQGSRGTRTATASIRHRDDAPCRHARGTGSALA
jgi:tripartite-type tricarboxylate transporter receptor subunit TctC